MSNGRGQLLYRPNQPQFFRIILADSLHQRKLALPRKFARDYGNNLSNWVTLKDPSGKKWKVGIEKAGGQIWLHNGWKEFVEYYSIVVGTFLVFGYDHTDCSFHVTIFDYSTAEIDYPYEAEARQVPEVEETLTEVPVETSPSTKIKDKSEMSSSQSLKNMNKVVTKKNDIVFAVKGSISEVPFGILIKRKEKSPLLSSQPPRKMMKVENVPKKTEKEQENVSLRINRIITRSALEKKPKAVDRARSSIQSKNQTFQVKMYRSYVECGSNLHIPASFAREHLKTKDSDAILRGFDGRRWPVKIYSSVKCTFLHAHGWKKFVQGNDITIGDVCTFELIDPHRTIFTVVISKCTTIATNHGSVELEQKTSFTIEAAEKFTSMNPFFSVVIGLSHLQGSTVHVPGDFIKILDQRTQDVKLQVGNRFWCVKLLIYPHYGIGKLSGGFMDFAKKNCLKVGDVCNFELIDVKNMVIKVFISRVVS